MRFTIKQAGVLNNKELAYLKITLESCGSVNVLLNEDEIESLERDLADATAILYEIRRMMREGK